MLYSVFNPVTPEGIDLAYKIAIKDKKTRSKASVRYDNSKAIIYLSDQGIQELNYSKDR